MTFIFDFDYAHRRPPMDLKDLLGGKGANLAEMTSVLKLPVPPGFTISTKACQSYMRGGWPVDFDNQVARAQRRLQRTMGKAIGDPLNPLLVSVRSGAQASMPGMMDTVLNLGLNDESVEGLARQTNDARFAYDSYRRFIAMYGRIVLSVSDQRFNEFFEQAKHDAGVTSDSAVPVDILRELVNAYKDVVAEHTGSAFPQDPYQQLRDTIEAVLRSWNGPRAIAYREREHIPHDLGTAVNIQAMVFGNRNNNSGTGVGFTRNPATGANTPYGDFLFNAQGEDVVAGIRNTEPLTAIKKKLPEIHLELHEIFDRLEHHYRDMCDIEFTVEQGKLWMLQARVGKRTGRAALKIAVDMTSEPRIGLTRAEAVSRITADQLSQVLHPQFKSHHHEVLARGLGASPGAAVGRCYFSAEDALAAASRGEPVILVRAETSPEDVQGILVAEGILTSRGGLVSHAAVVARGWGKPAVVGAKSVKISDRHFTVGVVTINEGEWISLDGTTGVTVAERVELIEGRPPKEFTTILSWADDIRRGHLMVRANADNGPDARNARRLGAEGIGLCRTEHMFLGEDRLPVVRRMILSSTPDEEQAALEELRAVQRKDFYQILKEMDGLPVTIRLLDPPLHEFLPSTHELAIKEATEGLTLEENRLFEAAKHWEEVNPMLGSRGVRLGVMKPGLYAMQVRALMEAAYERVRRGGRPIIEIMIPLVVTREELALARGWVEGAIRDVVAAKTKSACRTTGSLEVLIGTMIETPRAALVADQIAEQADFFSLGTNDLTQMTFGFSRDDIEGRIMGTYLECGLLARNPFEVIDDEGVGALVRRAITKGRSVKPKLKVGVCGEHGGDPTSIATFFAAGVVYVSCSPFRIPIARLSAAQAVLAQGESSASLGPRASPLRRMGAT